MGVAAVAPVGVGVGVVPAVVRPAGRQAPTGGWRGREEVAGRTAPRRHVPIRQAGTAATRDGGGAARPAGTARRTGAYRTHRPFGSTTAGSAGGARLVPSTTRPPGAAPAVVYWRRLRRRRQQRPGAVTLVSRAVAAGGRDPKSRRSRANGAAAAAPSRTPAVVACQSHRGGGGKVKTAVGSSYRPCRLRPPPRERGGRFLKWGMRRVTGRWRNRWAVALLGLPAAVAPLV